MLTFEGIQRLGLRVEDFGFQGNFKVYMEDNNQGEDIKVVGWY